MDRIKTAIYRIYKVVRSVAVALLLLFAVVYSVAYLVLLIPPVQDKIKKTAENELSELLDTKVTIGRIVFNPLNEVAIFDVHLPDREGRTLAEIERIGAGISIYDLLSDGRIVFDYAEVVGLDARAVRVDKKSPFNFQFIVDALKPKDKRRSPKKFDVELDMVVLRKCKLSLDVMSEPHKKSGFDANHINVSRLSADISIPKLKNDTFDFEVKRLSFSERGGFSLNDFTADLHIEPDRIEFCDVKIILPNSILVPEDMTFGCGIKNAGLQKLRTAPFSLDIANSYVTLSDLQSFVPDFKNFDIPLYLTCSVAGSLDDLRIGTVDIRSEDSGFLLQTSGKVENAIVRDSLRIDIPAVKMYAGINDILPELKSLESKLPAAAKKLLAAAGYVSLNGSFRYTSGNVFYAGNLSTSLGTLRTNGNLLRDRKDGLRFTGKLSSHDMHIGKMVEKEGVLDELSFDVDADISVSGSLPRGVVAGRINHVDVKGYRYEDIVADLKLDGKSCYGNIALHDDNADVVADGLVRLDGADTEVDLRLAVNDVNLNKLRLITKYPDHAVSTSIEVAFTGNTVDNMEGDIIVSDICYLDSCGNGVRIDHFDITSRTGNNGKYITVNSDIVNGYIDGNINFANIGRSFKNIASVAFPSLLGGEGQDDEDMENAESQNDFAYSFKFAENNELTSFFNLPVRIVHPITFSGEVDEQDRMLTVGFDAPYIMQGNKVMEKTSLSLNIDGESRSMSLNAVSQLDHKNGKCYWRPA